MDDNPLSQLGSRADHAETFPPALIDALGPALVGESAAIHAALVGAHVLRLTALARGTRVNIAAIDGAVEQLARAQVEGQPLAAALPAHAVADREIAARRKASGALQVGRLAAVLAVAVDQEERGPPVGRRRPAGGTDGGVQADTVAHDKPVCDLLAHGCMHSFVHGASRVR